MADYFFVKAFFKENFWHNTWRFLQLLLELKKKVRNFWADLLWRIYYG